MCTTCIRAIREVSQVLLVNWICGWMGVLSSVQFTSHLNKRRVPPNVGSCTCWCMLRMQWVHGIQAWQHYFLVYVAYALQWVTAVQCTASDLIRWNPLTGSSTFWCLLHMQSLDKVRPTDWQGYFLVYISWVCSGWWWRVEQIGRATTLSGRRIASWCWCW